MIIECPECQTRFRMADDKIKPEGTKVRCSRCRHIFAVNPEPPAVDTPAPAPVAPVAPPRPEPVHDSTVTAGSGDENADELSLDFDAGPETAAAPQADFSFAPPAGAGEDADEGSDLFGSQPDAGPGREDEETAEFSVAGSGGGEELSPEEAATSEFSFDAPDESAAAEFSFDPEESAGAEFSFDAPEESGAADFSFDQPADEAPGDFSFDSPLPDAAGSTGFSFDEEPPAGETDGFSPMGNDFSFAEEENPGGGEAFSFDENPPAAAVDTEEYDFSSLSFGEEEPANAPPPLETPEIRLESPPVAPAPGPVEMPHERREAPPVHSAAPVRRKQSSPVSGVLIFVLLLLLGLGGAAGYLFWKEGKLPEVSQLLERLTGTPAAVAPAGQIRVGDLKGYFVNNREAGQLFVIQGNAFNEFSEARSAIAVKGVLYNQVGKPVLQQTVFPGNQLNDEALQTLPFSKIEESMNNQFGDSLSNLNVAPGKSIPFSIVFRNLPTELAEFTVEVTDSRPGSK